MTDLISVAQLQPGLDVSLGTVLRADAVSAIAREFGLRVTLVHPSD